MLQLSLDLAKNRIGSVSQDIRKLFVNIMANLIEKSTVRHIIMYHIYCVLYIALGYQAVENCNQDSWGMDDDKSRNLLLSHVLTS